MCCWLSRVLSPPMIVSLGSAGMINGSGCTLIVVVLSAAEFFLFRLRRISTKHPDMMIRREITPPAMPPPTKPTSTDFSPAGDEARGVCITGAEDVDGWREGVDADDVARLGSGVDDVFDVLCMISD